jgi:hypothetical protein
MPYTDEDEEVAQEVDDMPASLREGMDDDDVVIEGEDISRAQPSMGNEDWMEPAKGVTFEIVKATLDTYTPTDEKEWKSHSLKLQVQITKEGIDGKGRYARKTFFPGRNGRILVAVNRKAYDFSVNAQGKKSDWYQPVSGGAFGDYNEWLTALGLPTSPAPRNDKAFRASLVGRKVIADITKEKREAYDKATKKSVKVEGEYENHLRNVRPVKKAATTETAEAAAS